MAEEKEVIVASDGGGGADMIIAIVLLIALMVGLFLLYQNGAFSGGAQKVDADIKIETPKTN